MRHKTVNSKIRREKTPEEKGRKIREDKKWKDKWRNSQQTLSVNINYIKLN